MTPNKQEYHILNLDSLKQKVVCLTLDVEQDYGDLLDEPSYEGLQHIPDLVNLFKGRNIPLTCFVQGSILETHAAQLEPFSRLDVEFELHSYSHPGPNEIDSTAEIERGRQAYREFFHKDPLGYRTPLGAIKGKDYQVLASNGFKFDSSVFPSFRPGVFNNLRKPTKPYLLNETKIIEFPFTVFSDFIRVPVALSYIQLFGKPYLDLLKVVHCPNLIIFDFHLHNLFKLSSANKIPLARLSFIYRKIFSRIYQEEGGLHILDELITSLQKRGYTFHKLVDLYEAIVK